LRAAPVQRCCPSGKRGVGYNDHAIIVARSKGISVWIDKTRSCRSLAGIARHRRPQRVGCQRQRRAKPLDIVGQHIERIGVQRSGRKPLK